MIVKCLFNRGTGIGEPEHGLYFTESSKFRVSAGKKYRAYGMAMFNLGLIVLIESDSGSSAWYPLELFEVVDGALPADWSFGTRDEGGRWTQAIWGYPELVGDPAHKDALIEGEPAALNTFAAQVAAHARESRGE